MGAGTFRHQYNDGARPAWDVSRVELSATPAEARARLRRELRAALPVFGYALVREPRRGVVTPVLHVGTTARPDVRDYLRVHRQDCPSPAEGDAWSQVYVATGAPLGPPIAFIRFRTILPARCEFTVALRFGRHDDALRAVARGGVLGVTLDPPRLGPDGLLVGPSLMLDVAGREVLMAALRDRQNGGRHAAR